MSRLISLELHFTLVKCLWNRPQIWKSEVDKVFEEVNHNLLKIEENKNVTRSDADADADGDADSDDFDEVSSL